jgi:hypothetical protein
LYGGKAIHSYFLATTIHDLDYSFFHLWIALENLLFKDKYTTEQEIIKRLKNLLPPTSDLENKKINRLYELRNMLIHSAQYNNISQNDRNLLLKYVEYIIRVFIKTRNYSIEEANLFFELLNSRKKGVNSENVLNFVNEFIREN